MKTRKNLFIIISLVFLILLGIFGFGAGTLFARYERDGDKVKPGKFVIEPPTLICLGFEWYIEGDDNHNATVEVWYRKKGHYVWEEALPLLRIQNEEEINAFAPTKTTDDFWATPIYGATNNRIDYVTPNLFAGSILDLEPNTEYECKFIMSDPDGVVGKYPPKGWGHHYGHWGVEKIVTVRTRPEPKPFNGGKVYHVYPPSYQGPREEPAFINLMAAYYIGWCVADWGDVAPPRVQPGDIILVHAGVYKEDWTAYGSDLFTPPQGQGANFYGTYFLTQSGTPEKPIVIKAAGDGEVIFDGNGCFNLFNVMAANYNYFEGLTIRNTDVAFWAGRKWVTGSSGLTVKRCRFENVGKGIHTDWSGSKNFYIADNVFIGRHDPDTLHRWAYPFPSPYPVEPCLSEYAVKVAGEGHVICHNYVANFHDGIDHATYGVPDGYPAYGHPDVYPVEEVLRRDRMFRSNDIYNNFITNMHDDFIEADGSMYNIRVLRNFGINAAGNGLSSQTLYGGPVYFIRNILYHVPNVPKHANNPIGLIYYHNTFTAKAGAGLASNYHFRNNLILGWMPTETIFSVATFTNYTSSDYNGFRPDPGATYSFAWNSPPFDILVDYTNPQVVRQFKTLAEYSQATGQDEHSILVDYDIFWDVTPPDPIDVTKIYKAEDLNFQLKPNAVAVDAGCILPNVNDDFIGRAPDLGALEVGQPVPIYGPRP
jgi:hypothetical protein